MPGKKASILNKDYTSGDDRKKYSAGSAIIRKLAKPLASLFEDSSEKAIQNKMKAVHKAVEEAPAGMKRQDIFKQVAEKEDLTVQDVKNIEKVFAHRAGGGGKENALGEVRQVARALFTKPTSGQKFSEELGGTKTTREARRGKGFAALGTATVTVPITALTTAWFMRNDKEPTVNQASEFEKAFSKAHNAGEETFMFDGKEYTTEVRKGKAEGGGFPDLTGDGKVTQADVLKGRGVFAEGSKADKNLESYRQELIARTEMPSISPTEDEELIIRERVAALKKLSLEELQEMKMMEEQRKMDLEMRKAAQRVNKQEGGSMLVPPEMESMPVDTYTPEEQANAEATQLPDDEMEDKYMDFIFEESLQADEQEYLMEALEKDPKLSTIIDKVMMTASEFSGAGEVEGPGTGVSDSIPARLSDGEFVITEKATSMLGADNLQEMMDDAERMADGGVPMREKRQIGGMLGMPTNPEEEELEDMSQMRSTDAEVNEAMLRSNQVPSLRRY
jgi:hypothetical protein